ncbi:hypothetical protein CJ030_MR1G002661 [Morella rubra]|uniref:Uncharacterized protein n=1 Tax=Morella rubra TaxID=262757 RepID=A0A6A1WST5_9ROSI|nr:hypothetical protein CJ030_MR1G002661 [Morella rubra]
MGNKPDAEHIFRTFTGQDVVVVGPFIRQKYMLPFWHILHLIFAYDIEPRAHKTECPIARGELMLSVARGVVRQLGDPFDLMESQMTGLQQFLTTTLGTLRVMSRRLGAIKDQMGR